MLLTLKLRFCLIFVLKKVYILLQSASKDFLVKNCLLNALFFNSLKGEMFFFT